MNTLKPPKQSPQYHDPDRITARLESCGFKLDRGLGQYVFQHNDLPVFVSMEVNPWGQTVFRFGLRWDGDQSSVPCEYSSLDTVGKALLRLLVHPDKPSYTVPIFMQRRIERMLERMQLDPFQIYVLGMALLGRDPFATEDAV